MDKGQAVELGKPKELLNRQNSSFKRMVDQLDHNRSKQTSVVPIAAKEADLSLGEKSHDQLSSEQAATINFSSGADKKVTFYAEEDDDEEEGEKDEEDSDDEYLEISIV